MSNIGSACERQLWYKTNKPDEAEELEPEAYLKFAYGHLIETFMIALIKKSGHTVRGTQDELDIEGVKGHQDCIVDEVTLDLKTASPYGFKKFEDHKLEEDDPFAYLPQITSYVHSNDAQDKSRGAFLAIEKVSGKMVLDVYPIKSEGIEEAYRERIQMVQKDTPPPRGHSPKPDGKAGNMALPVECSYCSFKFSCYPGVKGYAYSSGPRYLTKVVREPDVYRFR